MLMCRSIVCCLSQIPLPPLPLFQDAPILMLDEATSQLDLTTEQSIMATLQDYLATRRKTAIFIAHRLSTIADADRILVLDQGKLAEAGRHRDLLAADGLYADMWTRQLAEREEASQAAE